MRRIVLLFFLIPLNVIAQPVGSRPLNSNIDSVTSVLNEPISVDDNSGSLTVDGTIAATQSGAWTNACTQSGTWNINNISGTISLPTGAATSALQLPDGHNVTVDNAAGAAAVNIQDGGNSITVDGTVAVSGTVAVTQSGTWDEVGINDSGNSITIDNSTLSVVGGGLESSALRVTIANDSTGVLSIDDNGGSLTIDGTVSATQSGTWVLGANSGVDVGDVTINNAGGGSAVNVQDGGNSITVDGTVAATQSGTWNINNVSGTVSLPTGAATSANQSTEITSLQLLDDTIIADDAAFTPGTTKVNMCGFEFDDVSPDSVNEGDAGAVRMSANRNLYSTIRDAAGNERGVNVNASNQLSVSVDNTVTVASHAVTNAGTFVVQENGAALTALQLIDNIVLAEDAVHASGDSGVLALTRRIDTAATSAGTDGDNATLNTDANGRLHVADSRTGTSAQQVQGAQVVNTASSGQLFNSGQVEFFSNTVRMPHAIASGGVNYQLSLNPDLGLQFIDYSSLGEIYIQSLTAHDAVDAGNPIKVGFKAIAGNALPAAVASADRVNAYADEYGRTHTRNNVAATSASLNATASGNSTIFTPTAGKAARIKFIHLVNNGSAAIKAGIRCAAAGTIRFTGDLSPDGGARLMNLINAYWECATNEAVIINLGAGGDVDVTVQYEEF